ncbi:hypothetical protein DJ71_13255 [Halorubrum sp. E3]|uniref:Uncharacterized protein n=1 Tax=Halorubrum persicum TaxID=1383844 RepID=A0A2G1WL66_9EURY|nr:DUF6276 family protein [Halorubrum persicum]OYR81620.1 hypothetical protein DJ71_13255 [Halorubrum sp. E3]PHQ39685.1 hypothetical protein DJ69_04810 [Halorubrum persicum]
MSCPHCDAAVVAFAVPPALREHAPAPTTAICTRCLRTYPASDAPTDERATDGSGPDFSAVDPAFPAGEAGIALALACGQLESLALNRASIEALVAHAERSGADAFAFFERLDAADAAFDLERRRSALLDLL